LEKIFVTFSVLFKARDRNQSDALMQKQKKYKKKQLIKIKEILCVTRCLRVSRFLDLLKNKKNSTPLSVATGPSIPVYKSLV
jgi:hypothetical protein